MGSSNTISWHGARPPDLITSLTVKLETSIPQTRTANFCKCSVFGFMALQIDAPVVRTTTLGVSRSAGSPERSRAAGRDEGIQGGRKTSDFRSLRPSSVNAGNSRLPRLELEWEF